MDPVERFLAQVEKRRTDTNSVLDGATRLTRGQFFTPRETSALLAAMVPASGEQPWRLLDPGAGVGSLSAALVARWLTETTAKSMQISAYEIDASLIAPLTATLDEATELAQSMDRELRSTVHATDFILDPPPSDASNVIIMNPPYGKLGVRSPERLALEASEGSIRVTNLYAAFLVRAMRTLSAGGRLVAITPRSFANGPYFGDLRKELLARAGFERIHVFDARNRLFADADVLQENLIFSMRVGQPPPNVIISSSRDATDTPSSRECAHSKIIHPDDDARFVRIPLDEEADIVAERMRTMPTTLADLGLQVSTGRVVDFRVREHLHPQPQAGTAPLIYPLNFQQGEIAWPLIGRKPQALDHAVATEGLLLPNDHYVVVKRFSSKEEPRRVMAALSIPRVFGDASSIAFENHLNVFHSEGRGLDSELAAGLVAYLNSDLVDEFVRQFNGHTQINATDLRKLKYPSASQLRELGKKEGAPRGSELDSRNPAPEADRVIEAAA
jgi:adenine-specific DNA-methyltransferase